MRSKGFCHDGHWFALSRGVFDPVRHLSGIAFAEQLGDLVAHCVPGARTAVDIGTGSGLLAASLARLGLGVVATDVSQAAATCATKNCAGLDVQVRHGDMFAPIEDQIFDLAVVNPPYERGAVSRRTSSAFTSPDFLERLGARIHEFAPTVVLGFPVDEADVLDATGLALTRWRVVQTPGRALGLFLSTAEIT